MADNIVMPKTCRPRLVVPTLAVIAFLTWAIACWLLGFFLGTILTLAIIAGSTATYTRTTPGYMAWIILNHLTGRQRTLFQGLNFVYPWEKFTEEVDLRVDLKSVEKETYATQDGSMDARYVFTIRPDTTKDCPGDDPGEKIILFASYEHDAIIMAGRAIFSMSLSDYYGKSLMEDLLDKEKINKAVFEDDADVVSLIQKFEKSHGVKVTVQLEDSDRSAETQAARNSESKAKSLAEAVKILVSEGWNEELAQKTVRQLNLPNVSEWIISLDAKGLENLQHLSIPGSEKLLPKGGKK